MAVIEIITTVVAAIAASITAVLGAVGSVVNGISNAWGYLTIIMAAVISISVLAALTGYTTQGVPMISFNKANVLSDYVLGFPNCASAIGPVEGCILPSKSAIFAFPVALGSLTNVFAGKSITGGTAAVDIGARSYDFFAAFFGVFLGIIPLFLTLIKLTVSFKLYMGLQDFWTGYSDHALN